MQDIVDPVADELLAKFVVDSHSKSKPKGAHIDDHPASMSQDDVLTSAGATDSEVLFYFLKYFRFNIFMSVFIWIVVDFYISLPNLKIICADTFSRHAQEVLNIFKVEHLPQIS